MAIIKTYPLKSNYYGSDRLILSDMQPDDLGIVHGNTKNITMSNLKSFIGSQVIDVSASTTDRYKGAFVSPSTGNVKVGIDLLPLTMLLAPNGFDLLLVTDDPTGNPINKKTTVDNFFSSVGLITNSSINYTVKLPNTVGGASQVLQLPSVIGSSPHQLEWSTPAGSGTVIGSGTTNYIPKWNSSTELTDSIIYENGTNVGIGITSPTSKLQVKGGSVTTPSDGNAFIANATSSFVVNHSNEYGAYIGYADTSNDAIAIQSARSSGATEVLSLNPYGGNVGIGITTPSQKLTVAGTIMSTATSNPTLILQDSTHSDITIKGDSGIFSVTNLNVGQNITMLYDGNVGIGTTSPASKLNVIGKSNTSSESVIKCGVSGMSNGITLIADSYTTNTSQVNFGVSYSGANAVMSRSVKVSNTADDTFLSSQNIYATRPNAFVLNRDGSFRFFNTNINATTAVGTAVTLNERMRINATGEITLRGDGTNDGKLRLNCSANSHYVEIVGPTHSGGSSYSLKLPNSLPSVSNQILESNALGILSWIPTPSGGGGGGGTVTSVGLSTNVAALTVANTPVTGSGVLELNKNGGVAGQYIDGATGAWTSLPTGTTYTASQGVLLTGTNFTNTDKGSSQPIFKNIAVSGQNTATASQNDSTLELIAGTNVTITTNTSNVNKKITINSSGSGSSGISFSGTTSGGLATFTNSSTAGVSSKVTLNASGLIDLDADGQSAASIDFDPTGTRLKIGDFNAYGGIVELFTDGSRAFQVGVNGEIGLGTTASQGTIGQVLTSQGSGDAPIWSTAGGGNIANTNLTQTAARTYNMGQYPLTFTGTSTISMQQSNGLVANGNIVSNSQSYAAKNSISNKSTSFTVDFNDGNVQQVNLINSAGNVVISFSNIKAGARYTIITTRLGFEGVYGSYSFNSVLWPGDVTPANVPAGVGGFNIYEFIATTTSASGMLGYAFRDYSTPS